MTPRPIPQDPALTLVVACLRPLGDPDRLAAINEAASMKVDADRVLALAHRHRVEGFVDQGLAAARIALPPDAAARLAARANDARIQTLRNAGEEVRIGAAFAAAGIDTLFIKGATVAKRAHGTLSLKTSWDVDLLVARPQLEAACRMLSDLGYHLRMPGDVNDPVQVRRYLAGNKEAAWYHSVRDTTVELHTELTDNPVALPFVGLASPRQSVELLPGQTLPTLATGPLFAYLVYHGGSHLWARLKWLADVAALLQGQDIATLHAEAVSLGAGRTSGLALTLAHELLGIAMPSQLLAAIDRDRTTRRLLAHSRAAIASAQCGEDTMRSMGEMLTYARIQGMLAPGVAHRWYAARRFVTRPHRAAHLRLPGWVLPLVVLAGLPLRLLLRPAEVRRDRRQAGGNIASRP